MALLDDLYLAKYHRERYNCAHFAGDVWRRLRDGDDRIARVAAIYTNRQLPPFKTFRRLVRDFRPTDRRAELAIMLCEPPFDELHMGVLYNGNLLHLTPMGVECFELCVYDGVFKNMRFYK